MTNTKLNAAAFLAPSLLAVAVLAAACSEAADATPMMVETAVLQLEIVSGDDQVGTINSALDEFLLVRVRAGEAGPPVSGIRVRWTILEGGATIFAKRRLTDPLGVAVGSVFLGNEAGEVVIQAAIEDGAAVEFTVQVTDLPEVII